MFNTIKQDIKVIFERDPAARSIIETLLCFPGLHAIWLHRISHKLYNNGFKVFARIVSHFGRFITGIEIHPSATIGKNLFIDHGMGIVIGETTEIGDNVSLYQGVTLGGTGKEKGKRHPTIGNNVVIACGAKVLGSFTVGDNSKIGAGSVVLKEVPPNSTVVGIPGKVINRTEDRLPDCQTVDLNHNILPDPEADMFSSLQEKITRLDKQIAQMQKERENNEIKSI